MTTSQRFRWPIAGSAIAGSLVFLLAAQAAGQTQIVQIEEHWELVIGEPDVPVSAPQTTMVMSPNGDLDGQYFLFTINHRNVPSYEPGGLQVQLWNGEEAVNTESWGGATLDQANDTIRWVERLSVEDGTLNFQIVDGSSQAWGDFGGGDSLSLSTPTELENLNGYRPAISIGESEVGYAGNRVQNLTLTELRWQTSDGQWHELHAPIDIDADLDP
jgi:hypothetical protein